MFHGFQPSLDTCYKKSDIMINAIYYGSGLKKTIEARAHDIPLVTSLEGASGLEHLDNRCLLIAKTADDYAQKIIRLVNDREARETFTRSCINHLKNTTTNKPVLNSF